MSRLSEIKIYFEKHRSDPKRALGQNFLVDENVIERILRQVDSDKFPLIEIGPGLGALTEQLLLKSSSLTLVELDSEFSAQWKARSTEANSLTVIEADALKLNWKEQFPNLEQTLLVSNLPYQISSSLVIDRSIQSPRPAKMVLMFQKEVAQRITAQPSTSAYGLLSVIAQSVWAIERVVDAGPQSFYPAPKITSRVLAFIPKPISERQVLDQELLAFLGFVKCCFSQRRKLLVKNLMAQYPKEHILEGLRSLNIEEKVRVENLRVKQIEALFRTLAFGSAK